MSTSVWPADYLEELHNIHRTDANQLIVFLASPFNPKDRYEELFKFCKLVCTHIGDSSGVQIECRRADSPSTPNVIHQDIWNYIQRSDAIIVDISERNPNVLIELGVVMAIRDKNSVIIIQDDESEDDPIFDISPARYLKYHRSILGDSIFQKKLKEALRFSLAPAPYLPKSESPVELPLTLKLTEPKSCERLLSPANSHRRISNDGLEFGSFLYRYSWLTFGLDEFANIRVKAKMRFTKLIPGTKSNGEWMGIMLRSQHFYANYGHLIYIVADGTVRYTLPVDGGTFQEIIVGQIQGFDHLNNWVDFDLRFDESSLSGSINSEKFEIPTIDMPFRYNAGLVRFQTYYARACIKTMYVEIPE